MGSIRSVSLPSIITCRKDCGCCKICYAHKIERLRPNVKKSYESNLDILNKNPDQYWREVEAAIMTSRFFRFHVSGDIPSKEYLRNMIEVAERNPHCQILCFTKRYELVNWEFRRLKLEHKAMPENLHLILSGWKDLKMVNPNHLPEAHVRYRDQTTTARDDAIECGGNCTECARVSTGCWTLKSGQQVIFNQH